MEYRYTGESKDILKRAAKNIYDWRQPHWPEDLCLLRHSGDVWMASVSHESDVFFAMEPDELNAVLKQVPGLANYLHEDEESDG